MAKYTLYMSKLKELWAESMGVFLPVRKDKCWVRWTSVLTLVYIQAGFIILYVRAQPASAFFVYEC